MTTPASPVTTGQNFSFLGGTAAEPQVQAIYTTSQAAPERIEAVYCQLDFVSNTANNDVVSLQLVTRAGVVLYEQASPRLIPPDAAAMTVFLVWSRLGNDTAKDGLFTVKPANDNQTRGWCNMRLPDLVLDTAATVNLLMWVDDGGEGSAIPVSNIAVTVTRNAGAVSSTLSGADILPLLVPTTG